MKNKEWRASQKELIKTRWHHLQSFDTIC